MADSDDRTVVKTYVPRKQKQTWKDHADRLGMSQSEFVRSMVQAGRRGFDGAFELPSDGADPHERADSQHETPGVDGLEDRVLDVLDDGTHSWEELVDAVVGDLESELDQILQELQTDGRIRYSGRTGGYELVES
jgi:hypothetical protein